MKTHYDIIIVGGGFVGASLAIILAKEHFQVALIEATEDDPALKAENDRTIVLSYSSKVILETIKVWEGFQEHACAIKTIHVSDHGHFGITRMSAQEEQIPALGYVMSAMTIATQLQESLKQFKNITIIRPATFNSFTYQDNKVQLSLQKGSQNLDLTAQLLVAADGQNSSVRAAQNIRVQKKEYHQTAIVCNVNLKRSHHGVAFERFTQEGPLALLPLPDNKSAVIWTVPTQKAQQFLELSDIEFISQLQQHFGYRLGKLQNPTKRVASRLQLVTTQEQIKPGLVLLGNAAHTLHPIAGQGLNLALRDLAVLAEEVLRARKENQFLGDVNTLKRYIERRKKDQLQIISITDNLVDIFSNGLLPIVLTRNAGIVMLDNIKWLKKMFTRRTLGFSGRVPRLACGIELE